MRLVDIQITNYKSFLSSGPIRLASGFNVIVGQNNVGKTALLEAMGLRCPDKPHRSLTTVPSPLSSPAPTSTVRVTLSLAKKELIELLTYELSDVMIPVPDSSAGYEASGSGFLSALKEDCLLHAVFPSGSVRQAHFLDYADEPMKIARKCHMDRVTATLVLTDQGRYAYQPENTVATSVSENLRSRIYTFRAERLNVGEFAFGYDPVLSPDASNLARVLNLLQSSNPRRFARLNDLVRLIFPQVREITAPVTPQGSVRILIWSIDADSERQDLAIPLAECGTGIGQVLAILYVILTSEYPRPILIDEPQSFLHPGAIRKLMGILAQHPQHQYIVTTHSPVVVSSVSPGALLLVRKDEAESTVEAIDMGETQQLRLLLTELGARLSDVFGADNVLWVEGATEELCFPMILSRVADQQLLGTAILGVLHTGDFESRQAKSVIDIYKRLSAGYGLLPPAVGFIFDREDRSDLERSRLVKESKQAILFTGRKMYENYLMNVDAIAAVLRKDDGTVTTEAIRDWIGCHRWDRRYIASGPSGNQGDETAWLANVHGAKVLGDLFSQVTERRVAYDKIAHGVALTEWLVEHAPADLADVATLIMQALGRSEGGANADINLS